MSNDIDTIRTIEERGFAAWPAHESVARQGWLLRCSGGSSRRANAAHPHVPTGSFDGVRAEVERFYRQRGQRSLFRITPLAPKDADEALAEAGYESLESSLVMTRDLREPLPEPGDEVLIEGIHERGWLDRSAALSGLDAGEAEAREGIITRIRPPTGFVTVTAPGNAPPLGYGLAVAEQGWVGLFALVTASEARRRGVGRTLVRALLHWGQVRGADHAYLQVGAENAAAISLYEAEGFGEAYRYHYRLGALAAPLAESLPRYKSFSDR